MTKRHVCEQCKNSFCYKHCRKEFVEGDNIMIKKKLCLVCIEEVKLLAQNKAVINQQKQAYKDDDFSGNRFNPRGGSGSN